MTHHRARAALPLLIAVPLLLGPAVAHATAPAADDPAAGTVSWSVVPATKDGADGRHAIDLSLEGGASTTEHVAVTNHSPDTVTFAMTANDGYLTSGGSFDMLPTATEATDGGSWITVQDSVTVEPEETVVVPFGVAVPERATPGDHPAGVAASVVTDGDQVAVENRVGVRVNVAVPGEVTAALVLTDVRADYSQSWNPFAPGDVDVRYDVDNSGNVTLAGSTDVVAGGPFGLGDRTTVDPAGLSETIPGGTRAITTRVTDVWPWGRATVEVTVDPALTGDDDYDVALEPVTTTVTVWALPLPQLVVLAALAFLVVAVIDQRRRRRARLDALLATARAEGAAQAMSRV